MKRHLVRSVSIQRVVTSTSYKHRGHRSTADSQDVNRPDMFTPHMLFGSVQLSTSLLVNFETILCNDDCVHVP